MFPIWMPREKGHRKITQRDRDTVAHPFAKSVAIVQRRRDTDTGW